MLYFSKLKLVVIYFIIIFLSLFSLANFFENNDNLILSKKVNLGLDLQGGSYLLLEVDSSPLIKQKLQNKVITLRKTLKESKIKYKNLKLVEQTINLQLDDDDINKLEKSLLDKENLLNPYLPKYKSHEMNYTIKDNNISIFYSKYGLIEIKNFALDHSLEIVRRIIYEVGSKDQTIIKRGNERI